MTTTDQEKQAAALVANKLGFITHYLAAGQTEKQASAAYEKAVARQSKLEKIASTIRDGLK